MNGQMAPVTPTATPADLGLIFRIVAAATALTSATMAALWRVTQPARDRAQFESYVRESERYKKFHINVLWKDEIIAMNLRETKVNQALELSSAAVQGMEAVLAGLQAQGEALKEMPRISEALTSVTDTLKMISKNQESFQSKFDHHSEALNQMVGAFDVWQGNERRKTVRRHEDPGHE